MFRRVRFECGACGEGFVDWHDEEWERAPVFCVNCGEPIAAGEPVDSDETTDHGHERTPRQADSALGVLKSSGDGFRDTLRGLRVASSSSSPPRRVSGASGMEEREASDRPGQASRGATPGPFAKANSTAPRATLAPASPWVARRRKLAPVATLLLGFAAGIPLTLLAEQPVARFVNPTAHAKQS